MKRIVDRLRREWECFAGVSRALKGILPITRNPQRTFPDVVEELARRHGDRLALTSDRESLTYRELDAQANRYARWALGVGLRKGDTVALLMPNRPEFLAAWIGITRIGGIVALLNTHLAGGALAHGVSIVEPKHLIVAAELAASYDTIRDRLDPRIMVWSHGPSETNLPRIDRALEDLDGAPLAAAERRTTTTNDRALYIYTSGTTGLPKAANINHYRLMAISHGFAGVMATRPSDRTYVCLPMYHTVGGIAAPLATLIGGGTVAIAERFSASRFWDDIRRFDCTIVQYIGELCRYLLNTPPSPDETAHRLRLACGNGLRPDIWETFAARFRIPKIVEFYAATESNVALFNWDGKPGAIGRIPKWLERRLVVRLVRFDIEREEPLRGPDGLGIEAEPGEVGEALGLIVDDPTKPINRFEGYADAKAGERKVLRDVFRKGDTWFRTGDLMRKDAQGYFYFVDRIGDTYRWKGENVSTAEVAGVLASFPGVVDATVYGVSVPGADGRAGMATLVAPEGLDLEALGSHLAASLPSYGRPLFLRIRPEMPLTATFKQRKVELVDEGFDPAKVGPDALHVRLPGSDAYRPLDGELFARIAAGEIRL